MTLEEVKKRIEDAGITDDMEMWYIDISFNGEFKVEHPYDNDGFIVYN